MTREQLLCAMIAAPQLPEPTAPWHGPEPDLPRADRRIQRRIQRLIRAETRRGRPPKSLIGRALESGSSGPGTARRLEMATDRAVRLAPSLGIGRAIVRALAEHDVTARDPGHYGEQIAALTVEVRARLKLVDPEPRPRRAPRAPRGPSGSQTPPWIALLEALARANGHGPALDSMRRILN